MALTLQSSSFNGVNGMRLRGCCAVPLGHVHFTHPVKPHVPGPVTEMVSHMAYSDIPRTFLVLSAPYDLLHMEDDDSGDSDRKLMDARDDVGDTVTDIDQKTKDRLQGQKGPLGILDDLFNSQQK